MASPLGERARSGGTATIAQSELMGDVSGFEHAAKKSWQSFSTMKRFVCEASRLEYVSWRLWFMHKNKQTLALAHEDHHGGGGGSSPKRITTLRHEVADDEDVEMTEKEAEAEPDDGSSSTETEHEHHYVVQCVYCEMHTATLRCNGCCHDAYCVNCFKMIHKKGTLATHTAVKAKEVEYWCLVRIAEAYSSRVSYGCSSTACGTCRSLATRPHPRTRTTRSTAQTSVLLRRRRLRPRPRPRPKPGRSRWICCCSD